MYVSNDTTLDEVFTEFKILCRNGKLADLQAAICKVSDYEAQRLMQADRQQTFNEMLPGNDRLMINPLLKSSLEIIAEEAPAVVRVKLMRLTIDDLKKALREKEKQPLTELKALLKRTDLSDRAYDQPFDLAEALSYLDMHYKSEDFTRLLKSGKLPYSKAQQMIDFIEEEYKYDVESEVTNEN